MDEDFSQQYNINKIDVYKSKGLANRLGVKEFPAVVIIKDGKVDQTIKHNITLQTILEAIN